MLNIVSIDKDPQYQDLLKALLEQFFAEQPESGPYTFEAITDGKRFFAAQDKYDIIFSEIDLGEEDGIEIARQYRAKGGMGCLIYATANTAAAIHGYEVSATGFLVKPYHYKALSALMKRAIGFVATNMRDRVVLVSDHRIFRVSAREVLFIESGHHRLTIHTTWGDLESWASMARAEESFRPFGFARCNSCYLVNLRYVSKIAGNEAIVGEHRLMISRNKKTAFARAFIEYFNGDLLREKSLSDPKK